MLDATAGTHEASTVIMAAGSGLEIARDRAGAHGLRLTGASACTLIRVSARFAGVDMLLRSIRRTGLVSEPLGGRVIQAMPRIGFAAGLCTLLALSLDPAAAREMVQERLRRESADLQCVGCHQGEGTVKRLAQNPRTGEFHDVTILFSRFRGADHGKLACRECHGRGFERFPHFPPREMSRCMDCHPRKDAEALEDEPYEFERIRKEFEQTVHFTEFNKTGKENVRPFTCEECHEPHYFQATARIGTPQQLLQEHNDPCLICHRADATGPLADAAKPNLVAEHGYLRHPGLHLTKTRCVDCHTNVDDTVAHDLPSGEEADDCVSCHTRASIMANRHYRYGADPDHANLGFENAALLQESYIMGATRHVPSDYGSYLLWGIGGLFIAVHGTARLVVRVRRRGRSPEALQPAGDRSP